MKGQRRMSVLLSSTIVSIFCQACGHTPAAGPVVSAAEQSIGMKLAVPDTYSRHRSAPVTVIDGAPISMDVFQGTLARAEATRSAEAPAPLSFETATDLNTSDVAFAFDNWDANREIKPIEASRARMRMIEPTEIESNIAAELEISAPKEVTGLAFDLGVAPRFAFSEEGEIETRKFGGEVRIGQNIDIAKDAEPDGWYIFAGADGEAVVWDADNPEAGLFSLSTMGLKEQVTVGDVQAGVSVQRGPGELSLSYIHREVSYSDRNGGISQDEDFAGVTFTMRK